jgi:outer membrane protein assembly factor BamB
MGPFAGRRGPFRSSPLKSLKAESTMIFKRSNKSFVLNLVLLAGSTLLTTELTTESVMAQAADRGNQRVGRQSDVESRLGLTRVWHAYAPASVTNRSAMPLKVFIPRESTAAFSLTKEAITGPNPVQVPDSIEVLVTLETENGREVVSSRERGLHGKILGVNGALQLAQVRKELLERRGLTVTESVDFVPNARVFFVSNDGQVQAMDAETGSVLWTQRLAKGPGPLLGYAVSSDYVAVTHGTSIDILDARNGELLRHFGLRNLPGAGPVIAGNRVISPGANGRLELLTPFGTNRFRSDMGGFHGRLQLPLTELENSYVWAVEDQVYVSLKPSPARPIFGIPTAEPAKVSPAGFGNLMLVLEDTGAIKCFSQSSGLEVWTEFVGEPVAQTPVFVRWSGDLSAPGNAEPSDGQPAEPTAPANPFGEAAADPFAAAAPANPFGAAAPANAFGAAAPADPFGGAAANNQAADNPFAAPAAANPFGAPAGNQDPFAGGANPFGAGGAAADAGDATEGESATSIRLAPTVDIESLIGTTDNVAALLVDEAGNMRAIDLRTGKMIPSFRATGIQRVLTVTRDRIFAKSLDRELVALDIRTGNRLGALPIPGDWEGAVNLVSDRVYLQSRTGQVVCFRPTNSLVPLYRRPTEVEEMDQPATENEAAPKPADAGEFNPFGDFGGNPFGGAAPTTPPAENNPFGN